MEKVAANKIGDVLYIDAPKKKFLPSYVYYMLEAHECNGVCFRLSKRIYRKEELKDKEDWSEIK